MHLMLLAINIKKSFGEKAIDIFVSTHDDDVDSYSLGVVWKWVLTLFCTCECVKR